MLHNHHRTPAAVCCTCYVTQSCSLRNHCQQHHLSRAVTDRCRVSYLAGRTVTVSDIPVSISMYVYTIQLQPATHMHGRELPIRSTLQPICQHNPRHSQTAHTIHATASLPTRSTLRPNCQHKSGYSQTANTIHARAKLQTRFTLQPTCQHQPCYSLRSVIEGLTTATRSYLY
jgi:hypothetical protein